MALLSANKTLKETAFEFIKQHIVDGTWEGGTFLSEKSLSEMLQMSKTPIRSALDRLEMMGLVKISANQGAVVTEMSLKRILEIYELRLALETFAVRKLTGKLDQIYLDRLDENLALQHKAFATEDILTYVWLDRQFHEIIITGLENKELDEIMSRIQDKFLIAVRATFLKNKERMRSSIQEHQLIRKALEGDDANVSEALITKHIEFVKQIKL